MIEIYHLMELDGITRTEISAANKIRLGVGKDEAQAVWTNDYKHLRYVLVAKVDAESTEEAVAATISMGHRWFNNPEIREYFPQVTPLRSTRIGDCIKVGMFYMFITRLNDPTAPSSFDRIGG